MLLNSLSSFWANPDSSSSFSIAALEMLQKQVLPNHESFLNLDAQLNSFQILEQVYEDSSPTTPIYFVLSPGVDVISDVSKLAREFEMIEVRLGITP